MDYIDVSIQYGMGAVLTATALGFRGIADAKAALVKCALWPITLANLIGRLVWDEVW